MGPGNGTALARRRDLIIVNLEPFTRYAVYVKAYSLAASGKGAQSDVLYAVTRPYRKCGAGCRRAGVFVCVCVIPISKRKQSTHIKQMCVRFKSTCVENSCRSSRAMT